MAESPAARPKSPYVADVYYMSAYTSFTPVDASLSIAIGQKDWATARQAAEKLCAMTKVVLYHCTRRSFCEDQSASMEEIIQKIRGIANG